MTSEMVWLLIRVNKQLQVIKRFKNLVLQDVRIRLITPLYCLSFSAAVVFGSFAAYEMQIN